METTNQQTAEGRTDDPGFTLIELLIVIVILGILSTVVVFSVKGVVDRGEKSTCKSDYRVLEVAVEAYQAQNGSYPDDEADLVGEQLLREGSDLYNVASDGSVVAETDTSLNDIGCQAPPVV